MPVDLHTKDVMIDTSYTKGEQAFIDQYARNQLVEWCAEMLEDRALGREPSPTPMTEPYFSYAQERGWVSKDGTKVTSKGFSTAASRMRKGG